MATPKTILVLTTGGTIDKQYFDALSAYQITDSVVTKLLEAGRVRHPYQVAEILRKDSLDITDADRAQIVAHVAGATQSGIVITHGTDTMTLTAQALAQIPGKTIVLTGALNPARFQGSDAVFNIGCAVAAVQTLPAGVYIAMNGRVWDPAKVRKNRAENRFEAAD